MNSEELRSKRAAIRREIKERMQAELEARKDGIKRRLKKEDISVQEKRERYRSEVHSEKLKLMKAAKEEFKARKRMLGGAIDEGGYEEDFGGLDEDGIAGAGDQGADTPEALPSWPIEEDMLVDDEDDLSVASDVVSPHEAFILESTTEELEALRQFQSPIDANDALPPSDMRYGEAAAEGPPPFRPDVDFEGVQAPNLFYYIWNLIFHPIQTLDEFDEYIAFPSGLRNVAIFYVLSLVPIAAGIALVQSTGETPTGGGLAGSIISSGLVSPFGVAGIVGRLVLDLIVTSVVIAACNYLFTSKANFLTLLMYFAFVNGVTSVVAYAVIAAVALANFFVPGAAFAILIVFVLLAIWGFALRIIVLMGAYGYGFLSAFFLNIGAGFILRMTQIFM